MSYGIQILNSSGRTVIDTDKGESLLYAGGAGVASNTSDFPVTSWAGTNLIIARPTSTSVGQGKITSRASWGNRWGGGQGGVTSSTTWRELKSQASSSLSPSGYGLVAYDSGGTAASNIIMSATDLDVTAQMVASGKYNGTTGSSGVAGYYTEFSMDPGLDEGRYYALMTNTQNDWAPGAMGSTSWQKHFNYYWDYTNGKIRMNNYFITDWNNANAYASTIASTQDWAIFYVLNGGTTDDNFV